MIRELQKEDIPEVLALGKLMHEEGAFRDLTFNQRKVLSVLNLCVLQDDRLCLLVEIEGEIVGLFIAVIAEDWFSADRVAKEIAIYLAPSHRRGGLASSLIKEYLAWAKEQGVETASIGSSSDIDNAGIRRLFENEGFHGVGFNFRKRV